MKKLFLILAIIAIFAFVGCEKEPTIVGSWYDETSGMALVFSEDGVGSFTQAGAIASFTYTLEEGTISMDIDGDVDVMSYSIEGDQLELSFPDIDDFELIFTRVEVE